MFCKNRTCTIVPYIINKYVIFMWSVKITQVLHMCCFYRPLAIYFTCCGNTECLLIDISYFVKIVVFKLLTE